MRGTSALRGPVSVRLGSLLALTTACILPASGSAQALHDLPSAIVRSAGIVGVEPLTFDLEALSTQRYALVIGNGDYENAPDLPNAVADAQRMAELLRNSGYVVAEHINIDKLGFEHAMRQVMYETEVGAELLIFFAGHGVQVGDRNYILPVDSAVGSVNDLPFETVSLQSMLALAASRARSLVAILDSCRDNPFPDKQLAVDLDGVPSSIRSGFNPQESPVNSLIVFSTAPGSVALDGEGENSPFTEALIEAVTQHPERSLDDLLRDIRRDVYRRTNRLQLPWQSSSLVEPVAIGGSGVAAAAPLGQSTENQTAQPIALNSTFQPKVDLGPPLRETTAASSADGITLVTAPANGRIEVRRDGRLTAVTDRTPLSTADLDGLIYRPVSPEALPNQRGVSLANDNFELQTSESRYRIDVSLTVDACDIEASDYLDPEGVGTPVYPNELRPDEAVAACLAATVENPQIGRFHYQLGRAYVATNELELARQAYERANELGHTRAMQGLGLLEIARAEAISGTSGQRAPEEALAYFAAGVERGDPYAYHSLGLQLLQHPNSATEQRQGFELLSRALEVGHTFSMNALGLYFLDEDAPHYDPRRGLRYLQGSAERQDIYGIANLGFVYANGLAGEAKDATRARTLYETAAAEGHPTAPVSLGRLNYNGDLPGGRNVGEAIRWFDEGLARGDGWGGANAAWIISNGEAAGLSGFDAAQRAAKAAALRNPDARAFATEILGDLPASALDGGAQALMAELGVSIAVDGAFGPQSRTLLQDLGQSRGVTFSEDRTERLIQLARLFWSNTRFRADLN